MKFWLFDILACPIDKHYPLNLYVFSYANSPDDFNSFFEMYKKRDISIINRENIFNIEEKNGVIFIKDDIIIEKNKLDKYLRLILSTIEEFEHIYDKTSNQLSKASIHLIKHEIKHSIQVYLKNLEPENIDSIIPELFFLNKIKVNIEIKSGVLFCSKCKRWYPIIETIPQMLPDEFRKEEEELKFLKTIRNLLDDGFFKQDLKPFNL
jgi:uncharacterized protein YbaR (Trm112 family)